MRILLLCEGDAETHDSWSGSSKSTVDQLRARGQSVRCEDVDLDGADRWLALARSFSPDLRRWRVKYHLSEPAFRLRSRRAARHVAAAEEELDLILQIGATHELPGPAELPVVLYCDSNILLASHAENPTGADSQSLSTAEIDAIVQREAGVYRQAAAILTMSERLRRSFIDDFDLPPDRVHTVYAGANIDLSRIPENLDRPAETTPNVLFVGRDFERKGGGFMLRVFEKVRARVPEAGLTIVGPPSLELDAPGVRCLGFLDKSREDGWRDLLEAFRAADVFCLPTRFEPFGIAFVEAMLFGLPCVGPDSWAVPEIIADGETGFVVDPADEQAFADRLVALLEDRAEAARMGARGRQRALSRFTWEATTERMLEVFRSVLASR